MQNFGTVRVDISKDRKTAKHDFEFNFWLLKVT